MPKKLKLTGNWRPKRPSRTKSKKKKKKKKESPFHHRGLECKSRKSRDTWSNMQLWPWSTKWRRAKDYRVLSKEHAGYSKHLPTTHETTLHMGITRWSMLKSDWLYSLQPMMEKLYTVSKNKIWSWLWLRTWAPYCKIQLKLKEEGKIIRPFRYDLYQIPCVILGHIQWRWWIRD